MIPTSWEVPEDVYPPREDSLLLARVIEERELEGKHVLDMGAGSGVLAREVLEAGASVIAVDVSPAAVGCARKNLERYAERVDVVRSDLFENVPGTFDLVVFNPPYVPGGREGVEGEEAWVGGEHGRELIDRFIESVGEHLEPDGEVLLLQSSRNGLEETLARFEGEGMEARAVREKKVPWEKLLVVGAIKA